LKKNELKNELKPEKIGTLEGIAVK